MKIYVLDVVDMIDDVDSKVAHPMDDGEETIPELAYLHRDLIRGCTTNYMTMKMYYEEMQLLLGNYITMIIHEYEIMTSYDLPTGARNEPSFRNIDWTDDRYEIDDDTLSCIALTLYNSKERNEIDTFASTMPVLISYPLDGGGTYVINDAAQEIFNDLYFTEWEFSILFKIAAVFVVLREYIKPVTEDERLVELYDFLASEFDEIAYDFYDPDKKWRIDPVRLNKLFIDSLDFLRK